MNNIEQNNVADRSEWTAGGRVGVLLIHGLGGTPLELRMMSRALAQRGYTVSCPQLAGHCAGPDELYRSNWRDWCASVEAAHDRLREHCDVVIAGGLSMGAILALHLAQQRPQGVDGLLLYAPTLRLNGWSMPWYSRVINFFPPWFINHQILLSEREPYGIKDERIRAMVVNSMQSGDSSQAGVFSTPLRSFAQFNGLVWKVKKRLGEVKQPALIQHPRHDDLAHMSNALTLQRRLGGRVETVLLEDSYHIITLDKQRHLVAENSVRFCAAVEAACADAAAKAVAGGSRLRAVKNG
jgi:carboxylesterase